MISHSSDIVFVSELSAIDLIPVYFNCSLLLRQKLDDHRVTLRLLTGCSLITNLSIRIVYHNQMSNYTLNLPLLFDTSSTKALRQN